MELNPFKRKPAISPAFYRHLLLKRSPKLKSPPLNVFFFISFCRLSHYGHTDVETVVDQIPGIHFRITYFSSHTGNGCQQFKNQFDNYELYSNTKLAVTQQE